MAVSKGSMLCASAFIAGVIASAPSHGYAQGASCQSLLGETETVSQPLAVPQFWAFPPNQQFNAGDILSVALKADTDSFTAFADLDDFGTPIDQSETVSISAGQTVIVTLTVGPTSDLYEIGGGFDGPGTLVATFLGCNIADSASAQFQTLSRTAFSQQSGMTMRRLNALTTNRPQLRAQAASSAPAQFGDAGQAAAPPLGVWTDFAWSGSEDSDASTGFDSDAFALSAGVDTALTDRLTVGAAIMFGGGKTEARVGDTEAIEGTVGLTPYVAYQIDDVFSLQAAAGYNHARGVATIGGIDGDYRANRVFVTGEAAAFQSWGDFSLFASVGVLWGAAYQHSYTDDAGAEVDGQRMQIGSMTATAQPSWLIAVDEAAGAYFEPYFLAQYVRDFGFTKTPGAANDPDEFLLGVGAYGYYGDGVSGSVEATRTVGREDQNATSARATVRVDF